MSWENRSQDYYSQRSTLPPVPEEDEGHNNIFRTARPGIASSKRSAHRRSWDKDYSEFNRNGYGNVSSYASLDNSGNYDEGFTQLEQNVNGTTGLDTTRVNCMGSFCKVLLLTVVVLVGLVLAIYVMRSYCEALVVQDNMSSPYDGKKYCTCNCDDLEELLFTREFYETRYRFQNYLESKYNISHK